MPEIAGAGRRKVLPRVGSPTIEPVADGVWLVRGGAPKRVMNVYLIDEDGGGVCVFDAGIREMAGAIGAAAAERGGITRVVLGHAHEDHRGAAPGLDAPVFCHPAERRFAEDPLRPHTPYFHFERLERPLFRFAMPRLVRLWDGGPCEVAGTVEEGDEVAGFRVVHLPGHAPGQIGLVRERDGLALTSDCFYTLESQSVLSRPTPPTAPHRAYNHSTEQAVESIRKLAGIGPTSAWPGHLDPLVGDVRQQLERAADAAG